MPGEDFQELAPGHYHVVMASRYGVAFNELKGHRGAFGVLSLGARKLRSGTNDPEDLFVLPVEVH